MCRRRLSTIPPGCWASARIDRARMHVCVRTRARTYARTQRAHTHTPVRTRHDRRMRACMRTRTRTNAGMHPRTHLFTDTRMAHLPSDSHASVTRGSTARTSTPVGAAAPSVRCRDIFCFHVFFLLLAATFTSWVRWRDAAPTSNCSWTSLRCVHAHADGIEGQEGGRVGQP